MNRELIIIAAVALVFVVIVISGCGSSSATDKDGFQEAYKGPETFIVSGQSNSLRCDWDYFTEKTGYEIYHIGRNGTHIDLHIELYKPIRNVNAVGFIFINGGADARNETDPDYYIERMNHYRDMIHKDIGREVPFIISNIGYNLEFDDDHFDAIRNKVNRQKDWIIAFNGTQYFREIGMLADKTHYTEEGCKLVLDGIINIGVPVAEARAQ